jgi:dipeptidyl aminopeptidase/acylaminoacyl peptidase
VATTAGYGRWVSPLAPGDVARAKVSLSELCSDGAGLYWLESRPAESGRVVMVRAGADGLADHSPDQVSIRSRVHEYGGGAMCLVPSRSAGAFAYVDQADQRVWFCDGPAAVGGEVSATPRALTPLPPEGEVHNHGGLSATADGDWVLAVREVHPEGGGHPARCVVALSTRDDGPYEATLLEGHDFFGSPRVDPPGERLAVVVWDHPDMSWDASTLLVVPLERAGSHGSLRVGGPPSPVAGGPAESVGQPAWCRDGALRFVSDRRGWWQPYVHPGVPGTDAPPRALTDVAAEFHGPDWVLGQCTMAELPDGTLVARMTEAGRDSLVPLVGGTGPGDRLDQPCVSIVAVCAHAEGLALIGSTPETPANVWTWAPWQAARARRPAAAHALGAGDVALGEPFTLTGRSGRPVHGTLYRPTAAGTSGPPDRLPPLMTWCHGGPTSACQPGLDLTLQFFTTRGFAVACVDYAGSSGYGRSYRCALWGEWGVADAEDCLDAALHLAARGDVDPGRMAIRGGSAGGMTALNALAAGEGFAACVSWYGVTDLMGLVATTHDFEAHYTDRLIGPLPGSRSLYAERSPVGRAASMAGSVLLLQGTEDAVVPPSQAESMRDALRRAGGRCDLRFFEGEGHGFRRADTLTACLEAELAFYLEELRL